ncbi:MAG: hypothetical protein DRJ42_01850 [Deltaproteobacteria bacterium]|nr:MAG: hypothetical protein DRJ42_01850 [Deltaproteobacteria bacterium]
MLKTLMMTLVAGSLFFLGACSSQCVDGDCNCVDGETCSFVCTGAACSQNCGAGSDCTASCEVGNCSQQCNTGASCNFSCEGGGCNQNCLASDMCTATCSGGSCIGTIPDI